ncbi:MAG: GNAT family N-acetyltransferase [Bacteroidales bacterium]|nr:GNAT family N-acetyltransferase [Bacteroidales bacterium]
MTKRLNINDLDNVLEILQQDSLRYCDGNYPERNWVEHFITEEGCFAYGFFEDSVLQSVLLAEKLSYKGCMIWYIATKPSFQGKGHGSRLLLEFQEIAKESQVEWFFLNATKESLSFYAKHGFETSEFSKVYEHYKEIIP